MVAEPGPAIAMNHEEFEAIMTRVTGASTTAIIEGLTQSLLAAWGGAAGGNAGGGGTEGNQNRGKGSGRGEERRVMDMRGFDNIEVFKGGEEEWGNWSWKVKVAVAGMSRACAILLDTAEVKENRGRTTLELIHNCTNAEVVDRVQELEKASAELFGFLARFTTGEAATLVRGVLDLDGLRAYGILHDRYNKKTMGRLFRMQRECMYPRAVKNLGEVTGAVGMWEEKWRRMIVEIGQEMKIPDLWKMSALLEIVPKTVQEQVMLGMDEIGDSYEKLKHKILTYVSNRVEQGRTGGAVPMEVDEVWWDQGDPEGEWEVDEWGGTVDAVYPGTKCYECGGFGHMARECPRKGKGKGKGKAGEKGKGKGGGKNGGKGWVKGGWKGGDWKGGGKGWNDGKGYGKGGGKSTAKGYGYQGQCWRCLQIGHKANECTVQMVAQTTEEGTSSENGSECAHGVWTVSSVEAARVPGQSTVGDWVLKAPKTQRGKWRNGNRFASLVSESEEDDDSASGEIVGEVTEGGVNSVEGKVEVMVDSGASKSVWPRTRGGVTRKKMDTGVKLTAANGSPIEVEGEAALHFKRGQRRCAMRFLDADVRRPLSVVSAMVDEGNEVVFRRSGSFVRNEKTKEKIPMERRGGVYVMELDVEGSQEEGMASGSRAAVNTVRDERTKNGGDTVFMARLNEADMGVFRRQA